MHTGINSIGWTQHLFSISKRELSVSCIILFMICFQKYPPFGLASVATKVVFHHHHHQYLNREGRWDTTDDFVTSFLHFSLFSTALWDLPNSRPVHSLMLSFYLFLCLPCRLPPFPRSGELRTQKLKSHLVRTQSLNVLPLKSGVGRYIAIHATLTARNFFLAYFYPSGPFTCIFSKTSPNFFLCWLWLTLDPV